MAIEFKQTQYAGNVPVFWRGEAKVLPGGFKPLNSFPKGIVVKRGTLLHVDFDTMSAAVCKTASVLAGGTTTKVRVSKDALFVAGDAVALASDATKKTTVSTVDESNADYNVLNLAAGISGIAEGNVIVECDSEGAPKYAPNCVAAADKEFDGKGIPAFDAAYDAVVLKDALSQPVLADWLNGICLKSNPNILFIKQ